MRSLFAGLPVAAAAAALLAIVVPTGTQPQQPQVPKPQDAPAHRPQPAIAPAAVLEHLRQGNAAFRAAKLAGVLKPVVPASRPSGAGRHVAAVLLCPDAGVDVTTLFAQRQRDLLVLATAGPCADVDATALLERAVAGDRLSFVVVLTHPDCASLRAGTASTPAQQQLERRTAGSRAHAQRLGCSVAKAHALLQCEALLGASELLRERAAADALRVVAAEVDPATGAVLWHTARADELPIAPVK